MFNFKNKKIKRSRLLQNLTVGQDILSKTYKKSVSVGQLLSMAIRKNPQHATAALKFRAAAPGPAKTGVTFLPPNLAVASITSKGPTKKHLMSFSANKVVLPTYFNWADADNVSKTKGWAKRDSSLGPYTLPALDQLSCGSCWAFACTAVLSDRWAIWSQGRNPHLSPSNLLGCVSDGQSVPGPQVVFDACAGCGGGLPSGGAELMHKYGTVSSDCIPYDWCKQSNLCNGTQQSTARNPEVALNQLVPRCDNVTSCITCQNGTCAQTGTPPTQLYKAGLYDSGEASLSLVTISSIKDEIFLNGPVVGCMAIFQDMQTGSVVDGWAPTHGVYCNVQGDGPKPYQNTVYAGMEDSLNGYHAIRVVGWGVEQNVPDWRNKGQTLNIPYWICLNHWSENWMSDTIVGDNKFSMPGAFKIAMSNAALNLGMEVNIDKSGMNGAIGGCTALFPAIERVEPVRALKAATEGAPTSDPAQPAVMWSFVGGVCGITAQNQSTMYSDERACVAANQNAMKANCVEGKCVLDVNGNKTYADCVSTCADDCDWVNGTCGNASDAECGKRCKKLQERNWGIIGGVSAFIILIIVIAVVFRKG